jgi:hypothetical protein
LGLERGSRYAVIGLLVLSLAAWNTAFGPRNGIRQPGWTVLLTVISALRAVSSAARTINQAEYQDSHMGEEISADRSNDSSQNDAT